MKTRIIPIDQMHPDPDQPRRDFPASATKNLAASLKADGQWVPLILFPLENEYGIADGEWRWRAAALAEKRELAAIVLDAKPTPAELLKLQLKVNCLRKSLKPIERAFAYQRLLEHEQCSHHALAQSLNVSDGTVTSYLSILKLSPDIQARIDTGELAVSSAYAIARAGDGESQSSLADQVASGGLTRDDVQARVRKPKANGVKAKRIVCTLGEHTITVSGRQQMDLKTVLTLLESLAREARRARGQRLDVLTWVRVLRDKSTANADDVAAAGPS